MHTKSPQKIQESKIGDTSTLELFAHVLEFHYKEDVVIATWIQM